MKILRHITQSALIAGVTLGISYCNVQFVLGTKLLSFSGLNIVLPAVGLMLSPWLMVALLFLKKIVGYVWLGTSFYTPFATYIPTLSALVYWDSRCAYVRFLLPLFCMIAFLCHPVGGQAWVFTLYWFIPMVLYCLKNKSLFMHALSATFIQHAVGAVIWLYAVPTSPALWHSLVLLVLIERLLFAMGAVAFVYCARFVKTYYGVYGHSFSRRVLPFFYF